MNQITGRNRIAPERWPTERPLFMTVFLVSLLAWLVIVVTIIPLVYAVLIALFFFVSHVVFVAHVRGSAVRLSPIQFPDLYNRVAELSWAMDMEPPATYLLQEGGALNALATRFLGRGVIVLYSDLLDACEDDDGARDMIIAHELAHLRCGHLNWVWFTLPGHFVPFLGSALSRAREYTCDRFGLQGAGTSTSAVRGLTILSAGKRYAPRVNLQAFVSQRKDLDTGFMTLGEWLSSHPPLAKRIAAVDPSLMPGHYHPTRGRAMATLIVLSTLGVGAAGTVAAVMLGSSLLESVREAGLGGENSSAAEVADTTAAKAQVEADLRTLAAFIASGWESGSPPRSMEEVRDRWQSERAEPFPIDPFDSYDYGFDRVGNRFRLWSVGPDLLADSQDDLSFESSEQPVAVETRFESTGR